MDKSEILRAVEHQLNINLGAALAEAQSAKNAATDEESKAENKYDTRGLEASYIAQAQASRAIKIKEDLYNLSKIDLSPSNSISIGSLVSVYYTKQKKESFYFLLPSGGVLVDHNSKNIQSLSLESPLGKTLFKKTCEDTALFRGEKIKIIQIF